MRRLLGEFVLCRFRRAAAIAGLAVAVAATAQAQSAGVPTDLGTLGGPTSYAYGISDAGQAVGTSRKAVDGPEHAVRGPQTPQ